MGLKRQMLPHGRPIDQGLMNGTKLLLAGALLDGAGDPPDHCQPLKECSKNSIAVQFLWLMGSVPIAR